MTNSVPKMQNPPPPPFNVGKEMADRFQKALTEVFFPSGKLTQEWITAAIHSLQFASPVSLGCKASEIKEMYEALNKPYYVVQLNMLQFATLSNNIEARTAIDLGMGIGDYADFVIHAAELSLIWNEQTKDMKKSIEDAIKQELTMRAAAQNGTADKEGGVLKQMVGEA